MRQSKRKDCVNNLNDTGKRERASSPSDPASLTRIARCGGIAFSGQPSFYKLSGILPSEIGTSAVKKFQRELSVSRYDSSIGQKSSAAEGLNYSVHLTALWNGMQADVYINNDCISARNKRLQNVIRCMSDSWTPEQLCRSRT